MVIEINHDKTSNVSKCQIDLAGKQRFFFVTRPTSTGTRLQNVVGREEKRQYVVGREKNDNIWWVVKKGILGGTTPS